MNKDVAATGFTENVQFFQSQAVTTSELFGFILSQTVNPRLKH